MTLPSFFELENTPHIMDFQVGGVSLALWPLIRSLVLTRLAHITREQYDRTIVCNPNIQTPQHSPLNTSSAFLSLIKMKSWPWHLPIFYLSNKTSKSIRNGESYNQWEQPTAELLGEKTLFISPYLHLHNFDTKTCIAARDCSPLYFLINKYGTFLRRIHSKQLYIEFMAFLQNRITDIYTAEIAATVLNGVQDKLIYRAYRCYAEYHAWKKILTHSSARIIIISTASYGSYIGMQLAASDLNIVTAELQHGMIYKNHYAYSCAKSLETDKRFARHTPAFLLTYGSFWHNNISIPATLYPLGNPFFAESSQLIRNSQGNDILFALSDEYESFSPLVSATIAAFPNRKIRIRPHPSCRDILSTSSLAQVTGYELDTSPNFYEALRHVDVVIGSASTSLFEAAALGRRCFLKPSVLTNEDPFWTTFEQIKSPYELLEKIKTPNCGRFKEEIQDAIFAKNWQESYVKFVNAICTHKHTSRLRHS